MESLCPFLPCLLFRLPFLFLALSGFCLYLSFSPGHCLWTSVSASVFPQALSGLLSFSELSALALVCPAPFPPLGRTRSGTWEGSVGWSRRGGWAVPELTWPPGRRQAARWAGGGLPSPNLSRVLFLEKREEGESGREAATQGWELPGPGPWHEKGRGRRPGWGNPG